MRAFWAFLVLAFAPLDAVLAAANTSAVDAYKVGAGTCTYTNPFTQTPTCMQLVGSGYDKMVAAKAFCDAPGVPGATGEFTKNATCEGFDDALFMGVCVNEEGTEREVVSPFVDMPGNPLAGCQVTVQGCVTFGGGVWRTAGGTCAEGDPNDPIPGPSGPQAAPPEAVPSLPAPLKDLDPETDAVDLVKDVEVAQGRRLLHQHQEGEMPFPPCGEISA